LSKQDIIKSANKEATFDESKYPIPRGLVGHLGNFGGMLLTRLFIRLRAVGLENIPRSTPYVIAANHETYVDGMWIGAYLPHGHFRHLACIAAKDLEETHGPLGRLIVKVGRAVPIDRFGNPMRGLIIAKKKVDEGNIMLIHAEGTRSVDGRLAEMQKGAAYIAIKSHVPLLPVFIDGGYEVFSRHMKNPHPFDEHGHKRKVVLHFGKPLNPDDYPDAKAMTEALTNWMADQYQHKIVPRSAL
jgi:1-acyl-sn-glycerol-3-phosphate acyltransferase